jgi:hypothetical protein
MDLFGITLSGTDNNPPQRNSITNGVEVEAEIVQNGIRVDETPRNY